MDEVRRLRHDLMGQLNSLRLTAALLPMLEGQEALEYLPGMEKAADETVRLLDQLEPLIAPDDSTEPAGS